MNPLYDLVRDRTQDLRRTADAARRERELRVSASQAQDQPHGQQPGATRRVAVAVEECVGPCVPAETARAA